MKHRHFEAHECTFDYKKHGQEMIEKQNPKVVRPKVRSILSDDI